MTGYLILDRYRVLLNPNTTHSAPSLFQTIDFVKSLSFYYNITRLQFSIEYRLTSNEEWKRSLSNYRVSNSSVIIEKQNRYIQHDPPRWDYLCDDVNGLIHSICDIISREQGINVIFPPNTSPIKRCISIEGAHDSLITQQIMSKQSEMEKYFTKQKLQTAKNGNPFITNTIAYYAIYDPLIWPSIRERYSKRLNIVSNKNVLVYEGCILDTNYTDSNITSFSSNDWKIVGDNITTISLATSFVMDGDASNLNAPRIFMISFAFLFYIAMII